MVNMNHRRRDNSVIEENKFPGLNEIATEILKPCGDNLVTEMTDFYNCCL